MGTTSEMFWRDILQLGAASPMAAAAPWSFRSSLRAFGLGSSAPEAPAQPPSPDPQDSGPVDRSTVGMSGISGMNFAAPEGPAVEAYLEPAASLMLSLTDALQVGMLSVNSEVAVGQDPAAAARGP